MTELEKAQKIYSVSIMGIIINAVLATMKIIVGLTSNSLSLIADGIDSASDVVVYLISAYTGKILKSPPNTKFPFGYRRAETIATKALSFIIFIIGAQMLYHCLAQIFTPQAKEAPTLIAVIVTVLSIFIKFLFYRYQNVLAKKYESSLLQANALNMKNDIFISFTVLTGIISSVYFNAHIIDTILAMLISVWILKTAYQIFSTVNLELMDAIDDPTLYERIFQIATQFTAIKNPHRIRLRRIANFYALYMDIELDGQMTVNESHIIVKDFEDKLIQNIPNLCDIVIHVEPIGNHEPDESYGVNRSNMRKI
ncbi:MAG: cation transporter [Bacteriovoracaceae bacterium]|nr:cation transporter [Bacteriovoracaceae bacterium]